MEPTSTKTSNVKNGLTFGLIIGLIYCIDLFIRYNMPVSVITIFVVTFLFYLVVLGMLAFCGIKRRRELGGFIDLKNAFQTIFVAILVAELMYAIFNVIYLKYVDPHYFERFQVGMEEFFEKTIKDDTKREEAIDNFRKSMETQKERGLTVQGIAFGYFIWVCITGVFGLLIALIVRKKKPVFDDLDKQTQL